MKVNKFLMLGIAGLAFAALQHVVMTTICRMVILHLMGTEPFQLKSRTL